jgi:hypothetical protein
MSKAAHGQANRGLGRTADKPLKNAVWSLLKMHVRNSGTRTKLLQPITELCRGGSPAGWVDKAGWAVDPAVDDSPAECAVSTME